jgi:hypothetical protein
MGGDGVSMRLKFPGAMFNIAHTSEKLTRPGGAGEPLRRPDLSACTAAPMPPMRGKQLPEVAGHCREAWRAASDHEVGYHIMWPWPNPQSRDC